MNKEFTGEIELDKTVRNLVLVKNDLAISLILLFLAGGLLWVF